MHDSLPSKYSKKCYLYWFRSIFKLVLLSQYKFEFFHQNFNLKHNFCRELKWKTVDFVRCIRILMVRNLKNLKLLIFHDIQIHPHISPITTGFISSIKVSIKSFLVVETLSMKMLSILFLALEYWQSDLPNNAIHNVLSRYWNSYFSLTTGLLSSILVFKQSLNFLEKMDKLFIFSSHRSRIVRKFQNMLLLLIYLGIQSHLRP